MDRIHSYIPGWDALKLEKRSFTDHFGLVNDFLAECWRRLREQSRLPSIPARFRLGDALSGRDTRAVNLTLDGLLKLISPDPDAEIADQDLEWALRLALECRRRVKDQQRRIGRSEFGNTQFSYFLGSEPERFVETPESRAGGAVVPEEAVSVPLPELIEQGESEVLEFKATIRYDLETQGASNDLVRGPVRTVAAYLNTDGGTLLIGVGDDKAVIGLANDLSMLKRGDEDEFERFLRQALIDAMGAEFSPLAKVSFPSVDGVEICRVDVGPKPVFISGKQGKEFHIRSGNGNRPLDPEATHDYIQMHWG